MSKMLINIDYFWSPKTREKLVLTEASENTNDLHGLTANVTPHIREPKISA